MSNDDLKVCNLDYLYELSKGDMGFVREMIDVFLTDTPGEVRQLEEHIRGKNYSEIRQASHKLRSSIPYVGLDLIIGDDVMEIEELSAKGGSIKDIESRFVKVNKVLSEAFTELEPLQL